MCGIVGKVSAHGRVEPYLIAKMCATIEHRGPDSRGAFTADGVGLGIQRLAIIDLQTGDQPVYNEDESVVVVLNGEIYNYRELRRDLEQRGHRFRTQTDTEVIVHLYEERGRNCVLDLRGMFAFAIWDTVNRTLLLARDRVGKKPLFYAHRDGNLWFASEPKAILQDETISRAPDYAALDKFLHFAYVPHSESAFSALSKIPPATTLVWRDGHIDSRRYWKLAYSPKMDAADIREAGERLRAGLLEATRIRLRSDVPVGAFLSGGIDSSAVVAAMARESSTKVRTFSIGFPVAAYDETAYARRVASLFGTEHEEFLVEPNALEIVPKLVWHYGEPFADASAIPTLYLSELTRKHVKVALNGDGGDEDFGGYPRYRWMRLVDALSWLPSPVGKGAARALRMLGSGPSDVSRRRRLRKLLNASALPLPARYAMWVSPFEQGERDWLYTPDFRRAIESQPPERVVEQALAASDADGVSELLMDVDVQTYLPDDLLVKTDIASMAHSLEVRSPLLDHVFMEFCARLPSSTKVNGRTTKPFFKHAMEAWLPRDVLYRAKMGFRVPLADWFRNELREVPRRVLLDRTSLNRGLFRRSSLEKLINDHTARRADNAEKLWALVQLELWFRTYIDVPPSGPISESLL